jgi:hypothetical protein
LVRGAWRAADLVGIALHQRQQDAIGYIGRELGVDAVGESLHGLARGLGPRAVEFARIAPDALEFFLELASDGIAAAREGLVKGDRTLRALHDGHYSRLDERRRWLFRTIRGA